MDEPEYGHAMVGGHRLPIVGVHLCSGQVSLRCLIESPFPGCTDALVTFFGHDNLGITQMPQEIDIPPVTSGFALLDVELRLK